MNTTEQLQDYCLARLKEEQIEAFIEKDELGDDILRVPALERLDDQISSTALSFRKSMQFIHGKLQGQPRKGLKVTSPVDGDDYYDIYCYDPDVEGRALEVGDVRLWSVYSNNTDFDWTELIDDDSNWSDGWSGLTEDFDDRLFFLASVLGSQLIDLPEPAPLTYAELLVLAEGSDGRGIVCDHVVPRQVAWLRRIGEQLALVVEGRTSTGLSQPVLSIAYLTEDNIDDQGRLTCSGKVILTRSTLN